MSVSSLPEWKQLLLEKKRREEEERGRREKEEEEKLASMPAWKRGIIQRRKAKQETLGDREKERDACVLQVEARSSADALSDTDSSVTINLGSELSLSPDPALWLDADLKALSQVSLETIVPLHENPFIRTQSAWRRSKDADAGSEAEGNEREKDKSSPRGQDGESGRGREIELKIERFRDLSEGREIDRSRDRSQGRERESSREGWEKEKSQWKEMVKDATREREVLKVRIEEEEKETDPPSGSAHVPCMRTIRADNIIIIEQDRTGGDERRGRWREAERETPDEDPREKRGMKMDLREILAGGGSVTEIRASEVLIIKPPVNPEEKNSASKGRENGEGSVDVRRESTNRDFRTDVSWLRDKEKERPWGQATVIKEDKKDSLDDNVFVERGGRVSQLLSKFGEHPKPPSRSKSSDNFLRPGRRKYSGDEDEQQSEERKADGRSLGWKGVPKRSFSFSDRALSAEENGLDEEGSHQRRTRQRIHSDKGSQEETREGIKLLYAQDADRLGKHRPVRGEPVQRSVSVQHRQDKRAAEKPGDADGDQGFTVASVRNTEGISFARRVPIRQEGRAKSEREPRRPTGERSSGRELSKDAEPGGKAEAQLCNKGREEGGFEEGSSSLDAVGACPAADASYKHESAFAESSSLLCTVTDRAREWSAAGPQAPYSSVLSQQTEDLISKIEKIGETTVYSNEKGERAYEAAAEARLEEYSSAASDGLNRDGPARSPRKITPTSPLEIQIPRTVFYVAEETVERKTAACHSVEGQRWEGGRGVEKRDSWRVGKPLSRIESLREQIRQRELERLRQRRGDGGEAAERGGDPYDERGAEGETGREAHRKRPGEAEAAREDAGAAAFDVTQEAGVSKTCPQLPVSVSQSRAVAGEEATSRCAAAALDLSSGSSQASQDEDEPLQHEEQLRSHREDDRAEEAPTGEEAEESAAPASPARSPPSSPPHNSLAAMSRIYKLENVGSRSALCLRDRKADAPTVHLARVRPLASNAAQGDGEAPAGEDLCGVQTIQRQIEQFQLKEQQSPRGGSKPRGKDGEQETAEPVPKMSPQRACSPTPHNKQTITITASFLRGRPQDGSLKPTDCAPTPSSSPSSPSPAPSPSASPSPTPSPVPFSIRSASGGQVKRGATITITPRKPASAGPAAPSVTAGPVPAKAPPPQTQTPPVMADARKRYPTVEEIEVIGGYQNLEKSCLVKNRVTPKKVNVCFDDEQLEQVCEYPSETSMLGCSPYPPDPARAERPQGGDAQEEEGEAEAEAAAVMSKSSRSAGMSSRGLRVNHSCPI
ncbi:trichohyalin isoform X2 [Betta splendens]|uniref:Trichohyalin isoform X2 n=1 Tax=Betta splendens TaxID=158456 RepID=A0A9W2Y3S1_BETSP|nr:trichohyalin isoform X2 [Betta splendens]